MNLMVYTLKYFCEGDELIITLYLWANIGLHNGSTGKVVNFIYKYESVPRSGDIPEAVVVQFYELYDNL